MQCLAHQGRVRSSLLLDLSWVRARRFLPEHTGREYSRLLLGRRTSSKRWPCANKQAHVPGPEGVSHHRQRGDRPERKQLAREQSSSPVDGVSPVQGLAASGWSRKGRGCRDRLRPGPPPCSPVTDRVASAGTRLESSMGKVSACGERKGGEGLLYKYVRGKEWQSEFPPCH